MKTALRVLFSFLMFTIVASMASEALHQAFAVPTYLTTISMAVALVFLVLIRKPANTGFHTNPLEVEYWVNYIIQRLRRDNMFMDYMFDEGQFVVNGSIVHIPQPGTRPAVVKNRSSYPATAIRRVDTEVLYGLDEYSTDPQHVPNMDTVQLSYDKMNDVLGDAMDSLMEIVGDDLIIKILAALPGANVINTTGGNTSILTSGQTGTRKLFTAADLKNAQRLMNVQDVPKTERYALLDSNHLDQLTNALDTNTSRDFSRAYDAEKGILGELYGFKIMERSTVGIAAAALSGGNLAVNALGAAVGSTDDVVSLVWQKNCVSKAVGEIKVFEDLDSPTYYGDVISTLTRMGGRRRRADNRGVIAIKAAA